LCHPRTLINNKIKKTLYLNILIGTPAGALIYSANLLSICKIGLLYF